MSLDFVDFREGPETFGGLSGMLRQILSPSPEAANESGAAVGYNFLQATSSSSSSSTSIYSNQSTMPTVTSQQAIPSSHLTSLDQTLIDHMQILASESYPCPSCGIEFRSEIKMNYHLRTSHQPRSEYEHALMENPSKYTCSVCLRSFTAQSYLRMHEVTHSTPVTCPPPSTSSSCPSPSLSPEAFSFSTPITMPESLEKTFACDRCQSTFRYRTLLERHKKMHEIGQEKPYSCPKCFMRFETRNLYNHHAKAHKPVVTVGNNHGGLSAVNIAPPTDYHGNTGLNLMNSSLNKPLPPPPTSYPCDSCSKQFATIESLTSHKAVHRNRPLVCDVCGKGFTHRKYYVVHQRIHTGERPYLCAMCGKSFTQASTLTVHRRYHTGERPYTCTLCGKGFVTRTIMLNHMKKH